MNIANVTTAAPAKAFSWSERVSTRGLTSYLADEIKFMASLCDRTEKMLADDRYELMCGSLLNMAEMVSDSITDWSEPRPKIPAAVIFAWLMARDMILSHFEEAGQAVWAMGVKQLSDHIALGYHHP